MDKSPKRRKYKDNPYTLKKDEDTYIVKLNNNEIKVNEKVFMALNDFELDDLSEMNEYDRHIEHFEITEQDIYKVSIRELKSTEEIVEDKIVSEMIRDAINELSDIQKRRIIKYYFEGKDEYEIAQEEGTTQQAINKTLKQAIIKIKKILKN